MRLGFSSGEFSAALKFQLPPSSILPTYGSESEMSGVSWLVWYTLWREFRVPLLAFPDAEVTRAGWQRLLTMSTNNLASIHGGYSAPLQITRLVSVHLDASSVEIHHQRSMVDVHG